MHTNGFLTAELQLEARRTRFLVNLSPRELFLCLRSAKCSAQSKTVAACVCPAYIQNLK